MGCCELFECVDKLNEKYVKVWEDCCNIESPSAYKAGVDRVGLYFAQKAKEIGFETEIIPMENAGDIVIITMNGSSPKRPVVASAHIDTVHPKGLFGTPAVRFEDGRIIGPGVTDCKGGAVAALMAMEALKDAGFKERPVVLMLQTDEETGCGLSGKKTINTICDRAKDCIAFLNLEGYTEGKAVIERKGILRVNIEVCGSACHSAICYNGANAVAQAAKMIIKLEELKAPDGITCNCGVIHGGTVANTVAETCEFTADIRFKTKEQLEWSKKLLTEMCENCEIEGCSAKITKQGIRPAMELSDENRRLLDKMNEIYSRCGLDVLSPQIGLGGSDAAYTTISGIPTVDSIGVLGSRIHSVEEYAYLDSLSLCAKRIASVAMEI